MTKKILLLTIAIFAFTSCDNSQGDEDFSPYPNGKNQKAQPEA